MSLLKFVRTHIKTFKSGRHLVAILLGLIILNSFSAGLLSLPAAALADSNTPKGDQTQLHPLGRLPQDPNAGPTRFSSTSTAIRSNLPSSVDYSYLLPPVGDQGQQNSCVGWATGYYYKTVQERKKLNWTDSTSTSHQFSPAFIYNQINGGHDNGAYPTDAIQLMANKGSATYASFPYNNADYTTQPTSAQLSNASPYKAASYTTLFQGSWIYQGTSNNHVANSSANVAIDPLREQLADGNIFVMSMPIYTEFDNAQNSATYVVDHSLSSTDAPRGFHEITVVGYSDSLQAFRIVNQWGTGWGNAGFTWLSYSFVHNFGRDGTLMGDRSQLTFANLPASTLTGAGKAFP